MVKSFCFFQLFVDMLTILKVLAEFRKKSCNMGFPRIQQHEKISNNIA